MSGNIAASYTSLTHSAQAILMESTDLSDNATLAIQQHYSADGYPTVRYQKTEKRLQG